MRTKLFIAVWLIFAFFVEAMAESPATYVDLQKMIKKEVLKARLIENYDLVGQATVVFFINNAGRVEVRDVNCENPSLSLYVWSILEGKDTYSEKYLRGKFYSVTVKLQKV